MLAGGGFWGYLVAVVAVDSIVAVVAVDSIVAVVSIIAVVVVDSVGTRQGQYSVTNLWRAKSKVSFNDLD